MALVPIEDVRAAVLAACQALPAVEVALADALGLVTAAAVMAPEAVPPFDNTAMDGFAVRAADTAGAPVRLRVVGSALAGSAPTVPVGPGEALRIMTGAPMPAGADAVVMVERTAEADGGAAVDVEVEVGPGEAVRRAGDDLEAGDVAIAAGAVLSPAGLGVLASVGATSVVVHRRPRVGVLSTGDELVEGGAAVALLPGQIRDSNRPTLLALVRAAGAEPIDLGLAPDDEAAIESAVRSGTASCDLVLTSGGVSMGDVDLVKVVLDRLAGGTMCWFQVAVRPAKPFAFGTVDGVPVLGLPGNPVSSTVSFELFARPAIRRLLGVGDDDLLRPRVPAVAGEPFRRRPDGKVHLVRVVASASRTGAGGPMVVRSAGGQGSHQLAAMAAANGLVVLPDGDGVDAGDGVSLLLLS